MESHDDGPTGHRFSTSDLIRIDGAGSTHELLDWLTARNLVAQREATSGPVARALLRLDTVHAARSPVRPTDHVLRYVPGTGPGWPTDVPGRGPARLVLDPPGADPAAVALNGE